MNRSTGKFAMKRVIAAAFVALTLAACSESATAPESSPVPAQPASFSAALPGTNVSINSGSCTLISSSTGEVRCSYDIANPDGILINIWPEAHLVMNYQCVNSSTGKIQSSGTGSRWIYGAVTVTDVHPTATNTQLSTATLPNDYVRKDTKRNTCKGKQTLVITNYAMDYFDVYVDNYYSGQPYTEYAFGCLGSEDWGFGCEVI
jgi:hypothetical protein